MKTRILKIDRHNPDKGKMRAAASVIRRGGIVVFPTETVYGIGTNALSAEAARKIYKVKGRPSDNPLIVHASDMKMASKIGIFPKRYYKIVESLWPGPITFVVKARKTVPLEVTGGLKTVALRIPEHRVALELIRESGVPIAAPSANISKKPSATNAGHAMAYFSGKVDVIIDSGAASIGIESTILNLGTFTILRPGAFPAERIAAAFGRKPIIGVAASGIADADRASAPGMKYRHYSPDTPLFLYTGAPSGLAGSMAGIKGSIAFIGSDESCRILRGRCRTIRLGSRKRPGEIARNLFDGLIKLDAVGARFAVIESFSEKGIGLGIMNRIRKAANHTQFSTAAQLKKLAARLPEAGVRTAGRKGQERRDAASGML
jgi:L-threonylcarbamoyladenylate synthase